MIDKRASHKITNARQKHHPRRSPGERAVREVLTRSQGHFRGCTHPSDEALSASTCDLPLLPRGKQEFAI